MARKKRTYGFPQFLRFHNSGTASIFNFIKIARLSTPLWQRLPFSASDEFPLQQSVQRHVKRRQGEVRQLLSHRVVDFCCGRFVLYVANHD